jgi:hypothetical protein
MVGCFGSNKIKKFVDISQLTGGKVRLGRQDREAEKSFRHVARNGRDIDSLD